MLTVFNRNAGALQFYKSLGYSVDPTSPEWEPDEWEDGCVLGKVVGRGGGEMEWWNGEPE